MAEQHPTQRGQFVMQGRWTITRRFSPLDGALVTGPQPERVPVPVVPCDDAAIERAAHAFESGYWSQLTGREVAELVLRAAGETP